jgi:NAD(P)-dependent dehydrogenase (short-subunit alcohol dehydrogenase family)
MCYESPFMAHDLLEGQVAIVTGGGKGIGRAIALELASRKASVLVTGRDERSLAETVGEIANAGGRGRHAVGDVRDEAEAKKAVARVRELWGRLDVVVANAGVTGTTRMGDPEGPALAKAIVETNLLGAYYLFDAAVPAMAGRGRLVAVSSVLGKMGVAGQGAYCASKAGLLGLVRAVAAEVGPRGITCNAVCPGWVDTEMARERIEGIAREQGTTYDDARSAAAAATPVGRFVDPEEVAKLVSYLCSAAAGAVTGQALSICSGATLFAG